MEHLVYEHILNGGNIMIYGVYDFYSPLQMYCFAKALNTLDKYADLLKNGKPDLSFDCQNERLAASCFKSDREQLIYVANYSGVETEKFTLDISGNAINVSTGEKIPSGKQEFSVAPAKFVLIYQKLEK